MAATPWSFVSNASRRQREDEEIARASETLLRRLRRKGSIRNPREAEDFLRLRLAGLRHEELHAIWLDGHHRIIECDVLAKGAADHASVDARVVVELALDRNARAVILGHNHPSGVAEASAADIALTNRLRGALELVEVRLLEHFVVGETVVRVGG